MMDNLIPPPVPPGPPLPPRNIIYIDDAAVMLLTAKENNMKESPDILIIIFFILGAIAGASLDRFSQTAIKEPTQKKCHIVQDRSTHVFDCEVFNDYGVVK